MGQPGSRASTLIIPPTTTTTPTRTHPHPHAPTHTHLPDVDAGVEALAYVHADVGAQKLHRAGRGGRRRESQQGRQMCKDGVAPLATTGRVNGETDGGPPSHQSNHSHRASCSIRGPALPPSTHQPGSLPSACRAQPRSPRRLQRAPGSGDGMVVVWTQGRWRHPPTAASRQKIMTRWRLLPRLPSGFPPPPPPPTTLPHSP